MKHRRIATACLAAALVAGVAAGCSSGSSASGGTTALGCANDVAAKYQKTAAEAMNNLEQLG